MIYARTMCPKDVTRRWEYGALVQSYKLGRADAGQFEFHARR